MWTIVLILTLMMPAGVAAQTAPPAGTPRPGLPPRDTPVSKPATGKIRGRVLAADTNAPLRRAQVTLLAGQLGVRRFTTTDADGRYEFAERRRRALHRHARARADTSRCSTASAARLSRAARWPWPMARI